MADTTYATVLTAPQTTLSSATICGATGTAGANPPVIERYTLLTVRGQLQLTFDTLSGAGAGSSTTNWRLGLAVSVATGVTFAPFNPNAQSDASRGWLWLGGATYFSSYTPALTTALTVIGGHSEKGTAFSMDLQVRTKRIIKADDVLKLWFIQTNTSGISLTLSHYLRCLISRVA